MIAHEAQISVTVDGVEGFRVPIEPGNGQFRYYISDRVSTVGQSASVNLLDDQGKILDTMAINIVV